jgi:stearoyl-CoA desaturase (delta-9 desaturase)
MTNAKPMWLNIAVFIITFLVAAIAVPYRAITHGFETGEVIAAVLCFIYCGMSITAGYHRLWSHKTYQAHWSLRLLYALGGAFALQNSILHWSSDHRIHHKHVDTNGVDPYSAKRGFWFSHIGWMLRDYQPDRYQNYDNVRDLQKDGIVMWQHKYYLFLTIAMNFGVPLLIGFYFGDWLNSLLLAGFLRLVLNHHTTFFINSLAHIWGKQTYTDKNTARDNGILAFLTFGEGYHNYHHIFENDYRNGIRWYHFDPTKWLIKTCEYIQLTSKLKKAPEDKIEKAKLAMTFKLSQQKLNLHPDADKLRENLEREYDVLIKKMNDYYQIKKQLIANKKEGLINSVENLEINKKYNELKTKFNEQKRAWYVYTESLA